MKGRIFTAEKEENAELSPWSKQARTAVIDTTDLSAFSALSSFSAVKILDCDLCLTLGYRTMIRAFACFAALVLGGSLASGASPSLGGVAPLGAQRGTEAIVTFGGARLADAQEVLFYYPGIAVKKLEVVNDTQVKVTFTITADCRLGEHLLRLRTAGGISEARTFWVGALPDVAEKEPNSEFEQAQAVPLNSTVHGSIGGEDVDYFVVEVKKGQRISAEIEGMRLAVGMWDPYIAILNDKRFEVVSSDDTALCGQDGRCSILAPADGKYTVMVREASYGGGASYRLHIGTFALPTAVIPAGGKPGEEIEFRFLGDPSGEIKQKIKLPAVADPNFRLHCQTPDGISPTGFKVRIVDVPNAIEVANANAPATALVGAAPGAFNGAISAAGETDYFKFAGKKGQVFDIHCYARRLGSPLDPVMHLNNWASNAMGAYIVGNDDSAGPDSYFRFSVGADGEYMLSLHDHLKKGGPDYFYRIEVTAVVPTTATGIPKVDGNNVSNQDRQTISIPKGGRVASLVNVQRAEWGGPATLAFPGLPAGATVAVDPVDPGLGTVPVVFEAKADAPNAGALLDFAANPTDVNVKALSSVNFDVNFNIGLNNTPFHRHYTNRIAVAVTEAAPYSIDVIEPKAAVPQNGSINLRIVAKRAAGFTGPITVYPLFTPSGMGIAGSAVIPANALETTLFVNAAPNAGVRKWKTAVIAVADAGKGPVWTSSQLFTLEVGPPLIAYAQERAAVEQGQPTTVFGKVTVNTPFVGEGIVKLIGLPVKALAPDLKLTKDSKDATFAVTTDKTTPAGKHGIFVQLIVTINGEVISQSLGGGELRVDVPLPPKVVAVAPPVPAPMAVKPVTPPPVVPAPVVAKRLTRLEQLRLEQEEREKAAKAGTPVATKKEEPKK